MASASARCLLPPCLYSRTPVFFAQVLVLSRFSLRLRSLSSHRHHLLHGGWGEILVNLPLHLRNFSHPTLVETLPLAFPRNFFVVPSLFTSFSIDRTRVVVDELVDVVVIVVERRLWSVHLCTTLHLRREPILVFSVRTLARFAASWRTSSAIMSIFSTSAASRSFRSTARCSWCLPIA